MPNKKTVMRAGSAAILLAGVGMFAVQSGLIQGTGNAQTAPRDAATALPADATLAALDIDTVPSAPAAPRPGSLSDIQLSDPARAPVSDPSHDAPILLLAQVTTSPTPSDPSTPEVSEFGLPCTFSMEASAMPTAMVALDVMAPCMPDTRLIVRHAGLEVTGRTDALGLMTMDLPALETPAVIEVIRPDGTLDATLIGLSDMDEYDRVAVQWAAPAMVELHAMEFGAAFGGPGHIWRDAPGEMADAMAGIGGFLTQIGDATVDDPQMAQIYTFPHGALGNGDQVRFSIDIPISETTCAQPLVAQTFQTTRAGPIEVTPIEMTLPPCDALGDYLVLQNILGDLRLAAN